MRANGVWISCLLAMAALGTAHAQDKVCKLEITGNDLLQFDKSELKVAADCTQVQLTFKNIGQLPVQTMGHSWVLTQTVDMKPVLDAGATAGLAKNYEPEGDKRIIAATKLIGGGQTTSVTFATRALKKGGDYSYFCSFPGHSAIMKGKLTFG